MPSAVETQVQTDIKVKPFVQKIASTYGRYPFQPAAGFVPETTTAKGNFIEMTTDGSPAFVEYTDKQRSDMNTNVKPISQTVTLTNLRDYQPRASLTVEGLEYVDFKSSLLEEDIVDLDQESAKAKIESEYWPECAGLVKKHTGAIEVYPYHWRYRRAQEDMSLTAPSKDTASKPGLLFHIDSDAETAETNLRETLSAEEAERWLKSRHWGIVNVWKPIGDPAIQYPLALLDIGHFDWATDIETLLTKNNYKKHIKAVKYRDSYKYYYVKDLRPDEAIMFRNFDSRDGGANGGVPHGAVDDVNTPKDSPLRRSIEVRCLVLFAN